jgi:hypothetical protein
MDYTKALRRIGSESVLGLLVFCVTGVLTALPPAAHSRHRAPTAAGKVREEKKLQPAEGASIKILFPREGEVFAGDEIPLRFKLVKGKRGEHVHAYVDGELMGMFKSAKGTLTGIQPGRHTLELRVATADHQGELDAVDWVVFVVE